MEFILAKTRAEVLAFLYSARIKMVENLPTIDAGDRDEASSFQEINN